MPAVDAMVDRLRPAAVVHTAYRYSGPDMEAVNVEGAANVARAAWRFGARLVHLSTDVVFDGKADGPYRESDEPRPVTAYGVAKLEAERRVAAVHPDALILRTSLLYGGAPSDPHVELVLDAADGRRDVEFFIDELRCPVHVPDLADAMLRLAGSAETGLMHAGGSDVVSRFEFARLVASAHGRDPAVLRAARSADQDRRRPLNCALDSAQLEARCGIRLRGVREVLGTRI